MQDSHRTHARDLHYLPAMIGSLINWTLSVIICPDDCSLYH